ncbi:hypothetical protein GCM10011348_21820 [Marinobacterium nitratireducens]|uniref:DUF1468 domain-containing protein n=1 Tax=Marinobacterium nitratireducens TaxID=518897 RepID=A0A918DTN0_9GAMM|nr:tripartite tricarboxylate transporter TctB family protein [Marinobacterium nitratireducens]GGO81855.1 hypothetical protein GCM10011348_21820 [Marinobacterium nitratireducens]
MTEDKVDFWAGVVIVIAGLFVTLYVIPFHVDSGFGFGLSPRFFPYICSVAITALGAFLVFFRVFGKEEGEVRSLLTIKVSGRLVLLAGLLALGLLVMNIWGYLPGGMFLVAAFMIALGEKRLSWIIPTAVGWPLFLWLLFEKLLETPLPG